ncbi:hypothetical protein BDF22DRAFT_746061 [Syncephalis plumigaleata]|nr:hypothetical protein BDF22DRAFT_746061 [Syncephalis plumigaleata]
MSKVLLITGASRGIGKACVIRALEHTDARELAQQYHDRMAYLDGNLTEKGVCAEAIKQCIAKFGQLDAIIYSADPIAKIADSNVDAWKKLFDVNFFSVLELSQAALPHLRSSKGTSVMINSGASDRAYHGWGAYCTPQDVDYELSVEEPDVTSISLLPGRTNTDMLTRICNEVSVNSMDQATYDTFKKVALALHARGNEWNGRTVLWSDDDVQQLI